MAILVSEFKKIVKGDGTLYSTFYLNSKPESIINESGIDDDLNQFILRLYQTCKNHFKKIWAILLPR